MPVTLYSNYIDYNGNRTFVAISNCHGAVVNCAEFQCQATNCAVLGDSGETVTIGGNGFVQYNCNCACNC